jgi:hypothetical protein
MSTSVELQGSREVWKPPPAKPLDDAVWQAGVTKGRAQDGQSNAARMKAVKWVTAAMLLAAVGLWSHLAPDDVLVRFIVALGTTVVMVQAFHARHYTFAAVFGALALLYNPVAPAFSLSGDWQRLLVATSAIPFIASLVWRNARLAHND